MPPETDTATTTSTGTTTNSVTSTGASSTTSTVVVPPPAAAPAAPAAETDAGYPANTPVAEMTDAQAAAYWKAQARKHENRNTEWQRLSGGKTPDQIKADLDEVAKLRQEQMTDAQRQVEEAKQQTRTEAAREFGAAAARVALEFALGHDPETNDRSALIDTLDLTKLLTDDARVDTAKVRALADTLAPSAKGSAQQRTDFGAGSRGGKAAAGGLDSGRDRYLARHGKKPDTGDA